MIARLWRYLPSLFRCIVKLELHPENSSDTPCFLYFLQHAHRYSLCLSQRPGSDPGGRSTIRGSHLAMGRQRYTSCPICRLSTHCSGGRQSCTLPHYLLRYAHSFRSLLSHRYASLSTTAWSLPSNVADTPPLEPLLRMALSSTSADTLPPSPSTPRSVCFLLAAVQCGLPSTTRRQSSD